MIYIYIYRNIIIYELYVSCMIYALYTIYMIYELYTIYMIYDIYIYDMYIYIYNSNWWLQRPQLKGISDGPPGHLRALWRERNGSSAWAEWCCLFKN